MRIGNYEMKLFFLHKNVFLVSRFYKKCVGCKFAMDHEKVCIFVIFFGSEMSIIAYIIVVLEVVFVWFYYFWYSFTYQ